MISVAALDALALLFFGRAALAAVRTAAFWSPESTGRDQLKLEAACETGAIAAKIGFLLFAFSTAGFVLAISLVLPHIVPGAMCGTGVIEAMEGEGGRALIFRIAGLAFLYVWRLLERMNAAEPDFPLAGLNARLLLVAAPLLFLGVIHTILAFQSLGHSGTVDCCAVVYDSFTRGSAGGRGGTGMVRVFVITTVLLVLFGAGGLAAKDGHIPLFSGAAAATALIWAPVSAAALIRVFSAYHYEVLQHHCPWCLFLPVHSLAGFLLFPALAIGFIEAPAAYVTSAVASRRPKLAPAGRGCARRALARMIVFALLFALAASWPALSWRLRFGVWIG
jgi:hypothetical protein